MRYLSVLFFSQLLLVACTTNPKNDIQSPSNSVESDRTPLAQQAHAGPIESTEPPVRPFVTNEPGTEQPISEIESSPAEYTDIWARIRSGFRLSHEVDRKRVLNELKWYVKHPEYVDRVAKRAQPHLYYIVEELERRNMPLEFALLPVVESAYDPFAYSHGRAAGLWQFIPGTARVYGLRIDWWFDGRRDVRDSTTAAIDYLQYLHKFFDGDWLLALAAYNAGQGNVRSSVRASGLADDEVNFWSLKVLRETYTYVPRLLAISELIANPEKYHINLPDIPNQPTWQVVDTGGQLDLNKAASLAGITSEMLYQLNPGYNQWATHPDGPHELIVPLDVADTFEAAVLELKDTERLSWIRHKVKSGESLGIIAGRYHTTIDTIRTANNIRGNMIRAGDSLMIPAANHNEFYAMTEGERLARKQEKLEQHYGSTPIKHIVQPGDSFWKLSREYDVGMRQLARWNGMGTTGLLHPGTELLVYRSDDPVTVAVAATSLPPKARQEVRKLNYRVRSGESLSLIASKFNVTVQNIRSWNQSLSANKYIHPGDRLTLYVNVTGLIN